MSAAMVSGRGCPSSITHETSGSGCVRVPVLSRTTPNSAGVRAPMIAAFEGRDDESQRGDDVQRARDDPPRDRRPDLLRVGPCEITISTIRAPPTEGHGSRPAQRHHR